VVAEPGNLLVPAALRERQKQGAKYENDKKGYVRRIADSPKETAEGGYPETAHGDNISPHYMLCMGIIDKPYRVYSGNVAHNLTGTAV
jgi:hypothetical protein